MKKYNTILFDIDDTIIDFDKDQRIAFYNAMKQIGYECDDEMYESYNEINLGLWSLLDQGKTTLQKLFIERFEIFFDKYKINANPQEFNKILTLCFQKTGTAIDGAKDVLEKLKDDFEIVAITNGPKDQQYHRIENAGFTKYFSNIFVSEEIGYNKPDIKYYEVVLNSIKNKDKTKMLIIGDSINSDIQGGINIGVETCWYNVHNIKNTTNIKPKYEISKIDEILKVVGEGCK